MQGRRLGPAEIETIRQWRRDHPEWSRQQLSIHLAQQWQWRNQAGQLKDMAARALLLKLHTRGLIELPPPSRSGGNRRRAPTPAAVQLEWPTPTPPLLHCALPELQPIQMEWVQSRAQRHRVRQLLQAHHYQGYSGAVGQNVQYLFRDVCGRELAVMVFGSAAWKVAVRDQFIGWSPAQRQERLARLTNQQRFLILPWVQVPHLASHLLALATRRLARDWQERYGHGVWLVETFVEKERFSGTAYKAAGWRCLGETTGRTRQDTHRTLQVPLKTVWVRPLHREFRSHLLA